jgi:hypothetical protein
VSYKIRKLDLQNSNDVEVAFTIIKQLRVHLSFEEFRTSIAKLIAENYELWAYFEGNQLARLASSRVYTDLVRGTHIYIGGGK